MVERGERNISLISVERIAKVVGVQPWQMIHPGRTRRP